MLLHRWTTAAAIAALAIGGSLAAPRAVSAQATAGQDTAAKAKPPEKVKRGGANYINEAEIAAVSEENAYDIIQRLRPNMLRARGSSASTEGEGGGIVVYFDEARYGGLESLRNISRTQIKDIRFLSGPDATQRYGTGVPAGAIVVSSRR